MEKWKYLTYINILIYSFVFIYSLNDINVFYISSHFYIDEYYINYNKLIAIFHINYVYNKRICIPTNVVYFNTTNTQHPHVKIILSEIINTSDFFEIQSYS